MAGITRGTFGPRSPAHIVRIGLVTLALFACLAAMSFGQSAYLVKDIYPGTQFSRLGDLTDLNGTLFFRATDDLNGNGIELWKSDGTAIGTVLVRNIATCASPNSSSPENLTNVNGILFFSANDCVHGRELWKSNGMTAGTVLVKDIYSGIYSFLGSDPSFLTAVGSTVFFVARDPTNGTELWKSDGSDVGTVLVKDIVSGTGSSY